MLLSILVLDLQAILYGLLCSVTNLAILLFLMVCQTSTTTPISTPALTPKEEMQYLIANVVVTSIMYANQLSRCNILTAKVLSSATDAASAQHT